MARGIKRNKKHCGIPEDYVSRFDTMFKDTDSNKDQLMAEYMNTKPYINMEWPEASKALKENCKISAEYVSKYDIIYQNGMLKQWIHS